MEALKDGLQALDADQVARALVLAAGTLLFLRLFRRHFHAPLTTVPHVPSWLPYIGSAAAYFSSPVPFTITHRAKYGDAYTITAFGKTWLFLFRKEDIDAVMILPDKKASMVKAVRDFAGPTLPKNNDDDKNLPAGLREIISSKNAVSSVPMFVHALRPQRLRAWVPSIRQVLTTSFDKLPAESGKVDLFGWCQDLICAITVRVLLGNRVLRDPHLLGKWVDLFHKADPESGFKGSLLTTLSSIAEVTLRGERKIYQQVRECAFPFIDEEIEKCLAGEPEEDDASVLSSLVRGYYERKFHRNAEWLRAARTHIANDLFLFTFAALSNSFGMAAWVLFHTIRNTNGVGDRIRAEMKKMESDATFTAIDCPELENTILEIGRLYTPGSLPRKLMQPWKMPSTGETIPTGTTLVVNAYNVMRDPHVFKDALNFDPSRYYGPDRGEEQKNYGCMFFPFGTGTHPCPGNRFAHLEIAMFASEALRQFKWTLVEDPSWGTDDLTNHAINVPRHPKLDAKQAGFIWRPADKILVKYERIAKK